MNENEMKNNEFFGTAKTDNQDNYMDGFNDRQDTAEIGHIAPVYSRPTDEYSYHRYTSQFEDEEKNRKPKKPAKKSHKGRNAAIIACSLALALCVGFGGGVLGAAMTKSPDKETKTVVTTNEGSIVQASTSKGEDSGLKIVEAASTSENTSSQSGSIADVVSRIKDSVVEITTESTSYSSFYGQYVTQGAGSGVIISDDGYIVTNNHVIEDATNINVTTTNGKEYKAKLIGTDATLDVALIKIEAENLTVATFGDSSKLSVGQTSIVIGNPLGQLGGTVTKGIVSSLKRNIKIDGQSMELLQTDAAINPGNSGGGMFDENGNLIGIVVAKSAQTSSGIAVEGIGFAIPINNVKSILGDLKANGKVTGRAALNVTLVDVNTETSKRRYGVDETGVYLGSVDKDGAAGKAGAMVGDRVVKIGDKTVSKMDDVTEELRNHKAGDTIKMVVSRDGEEKELSVVLDEADSTGSESKSRNSNNFNPGNSFGSYDDDEEEWLRRFFN